MEYPDFDQKLSRRRPVWGSGKGWSEGKEVG
jgi:hypothetical protein